MHRLAVRRTLNCFHLYRIQLGKDVSALMCQSLEMIWLDYYQCCIGKSSRTCTHICIHGCTHVRCYFTSKYSVKTICGDTMWYPQLVMKRTGGYNSTFRSVCSDRLQENAGRWRISAWKRAGGKLVGRGSLEWWDRSVCSLSWISC